MVITLSIPRQNTSAINSLIPHFASLAKSASSIDIACGMLVDRCTSSTIISSTLAIFFVSIKNFAASLKSSCCVPSLVTFFSFLFLNLSNVSSKSKVASVYLNLKHLPIAALSVL